MENSVWYSIRFCKNEMVHPAGVAEWNRWLVFEVIHLGVGSVQQEDYWNV